MTYLDDTPTHDPPPSARRPAYRVPLGMPLRDDGRRASALVSLAIHALIIGLLVVPFFLPNTVLARITQGAGGAGPAGGGGGGRGGTGGTVETLRYVRIAPDPVPTPTSIAPTPPPPKPVVVPPKVEPPKPKPIESQPAPPQQSAVPAAQATVASVVPGAGGGSGTDGTAGAGPGSGGGVGSGVGTGRGSANGSGTGGGTQTNYQPQVINLNLPPMPPPKSVRGWTMIANFDVDSTGRVLDFKVNESPDGSFNRQLVSVLRTYKFRPGTRPDGTPIRMVAQLSFDF
jgi:periplasmic protein TonB